jgi:hypothetical protein
LLTLSTIIKVTKLFFVFELVEFEYALEYFEKLIEIDPFRYENMDMYNFQKKENLILDIRISSISRKIKVSLQI